MKDFIKLIKTLNTTNDENINSDLPCDNNNNIYIARQISTILFERIKSYTYDKEQICPLFDILTIENIIELLYPQYTEYAENI